jgi:hypothetical protein
MKVQRRIENLSLFVLIGLVALRPLVGESYDPAGSTLTEALGVVSDPQPLTTLVFDLLVLGSTCGWLLARAMGSPRTYRRTGLEWGAVLVAVAAVVSCFFAGNKRLAINATIDWLCLPILAITLVQLLREPWQRRVLLAAVLASACVEAAQCLEQYFSFNETWAHYQSIKPDFWVRQGVELDSSKVELFEQRMRAREATGFLPHSNVAGSYLVLCCFAGLGLIATLWSNLKQSGNALIAFLCTVGTALMLVGIVLTKSLGALLSGLAGLVLWIIARRFATWIDAHRARAWMIAWLCVVAGAGAVIGHGLYRGSLPGWSLTFRWQYWQASSNLIADHWTTGVGRENFGRHYLRYKSIESPEEVANPHSLFVQAAADWGLLGLIGVLVLVLQASFRFITLPPARSPPTGGGSATPSRSTTIVWAIGLLLVVTVGRLPLLGSTDPNFLYYSTVITGFVWLLGFFVFMGTTVTQGSAFGGFHSARDSNVSMAVAVGLFAFLVHDMINFAMFVPGSATTFFGLLSYWMARRSNESAEPKLDVAVSFARRWFPLGAGVAAMVLVCWIGVIPVASAQSHLRAAQQAASIPLSGSLQEHPASGRFDAASASDPFDPTAEVARTQWLRTSAPRAAVEALTTAMGRDPFNVGLPRMRAKLYLDLAQSTGDDGDYLAAIDDAHRALELYPLNPAGVVSLADVQTVAGEALKSEKLLREALANYNRAIQLDDQRLSWETLHRMRVGEKDEILAKIRRVRERIGEP